MSTTGFNPAAPGPTPLTIGTVQFWTFECPSDLPIGATVQNIAVTELIGGGRAVHQLGVQPKPVTWRGKLLQPNVASRISALRQMCVLGQPVSLSWWYESYQCIIKEFIPTYHHTNYAEYEITVEIISSTNGVLTGNPPAPPTPDQQVNAVVTVLQGQYANLAGIDSTGPTAFEQDLATFEAALAAAGPLSQLTQAGSVNLTTLLQTALAGVTTYLNAQSPTSAEYLYASQMVNSLTLIGKNISAAQSTQTVTVTGGSLYAIASKYYGDPSQAFMLMQANNLSSPQLSTQQPTIIALPPAPLAVAA